MVCQPPLQLRARLTVCVQETLRPAAAVMERSLTPLNTPLLDLRARGQLQVCGPKVHGGVSTHGFPKGWDGLRLQALGEQTPPCSLSLLRPLMQAGPPEPEIKEAGDGCAGLCSLGLDDGDSVCPFLMSGAETWAVKP